MIRGMSELLKKEIYRLKTYYNTLRKLLEVHFSGYTIESNEETNRYYLQLCMEIEKILKSSDFSRLSTYIWRPFDNLLSIDPDAPEDNWEYGGRQSCTDFQSKIEEIFIENGQQNYELNDLDTILINSVNLFVQNYEKQKNESSRQFEENAKKMAEDFRNQQVVDQIPAKPRSSTSKKPKKLTYTMAKEGFDEILLEIDQFFEEGMPTDNETVDELLEKIYGLIKSSFLDGGGRVFAFKRSIEDIDWDATQDFYKNARDVEFHDVYRYVNSKKLEFMGKEIGKIIKDLIQLNKEEIRNKPPVKESSLVPAQSELNLPDSLEIENLKDGFLWDMQVFISHRFVSNDKALASILKSILKDKKIFGYLASKKKEYTLPIDEKYKIV